MRYVDSTAEYRPFPSLALKNSVHSALEVPAAARALRLPRDSALLEVGCGRGFALASLARCCRPARLVGVDVDRDALVEASHRLADAGVDAELVVADARALPFPAASFDAVVDFGTCYHVARPEAALREIERVLRPGGLFAHETRVGQLVAHPIRAFGRALPWSASPSLVPCGDRVLWATRRREAT